MTNEQLKLQLASKAGELFHKSEIRRLMLEAASRIQSWQPIESAPRDRVIWIYISHNSSDEIGGWMTTAIYTENGFFSTSDSNPGAEFLNPSHWQDMPPSPEVKYV